MELTLTGWVLAVIAAFAVGMAKGGFSMVGMISVPLLSFVISPVAAAGMLLPVYIVSDLGGLIAFRRSFDRQVLRSILPGAVTGVGFGWATAHVVNDAVVTLIVGAIGFVFAAMALARPNMGKAAHPRWGAGSFWGALAGYTSFVSHSGGPPWQIYVQPMGLSAAQYAGTTTVFFALVNAVKLVPYAALGQLGAENLRVSAMLFVPAIAGVFVGLRLLKIVPQALFYKLITWALLLISLRLIWAGWAAI